MKKLLYSAILLLLTSGVALSQLGISKGIKGGLNLSTIGGSDAPSGLTMYTGYAAGIYVEINLPGPISIQPEALYSAVGSKYEVPNVSRTTGKASYLEIPVLVKFSLPIPVVSPCIFAGPSMGFLLSAKQVNDNLINNTSTETDVKDHVSKTNFGIVVGVGVKLSVLSVDARYNMGLTKTDKDGNLKIYTRVIGLYVGIEL